LKGIDWHDQVSHKLIIAHFTNHSVDTFVLSQLKEKIICKKNETAFGKKSGFNFWKSIVQQDLEGNVRIKKL